MKKASISELKNRLSAYLKEVRSGETILILDRNQPIARIERVSGDAHPEGALDRLERAGLIRRATVRLPIKLLRSNAPKSKASVVQALLQERRESR
ncbi:MAG: type II toxin-antitoxin system Phd/YefM family antitoxin [Vicinamibacteria bacterium]